MTYQQAAKDAIAVQDACNLSGVVFTFADAMRAVCDEQQKRTMGTEWKNRNPIVTLFLSKLADLNGHMFDCDYGVAMDACTAIIDGKDV